MKTAMTDEEKRIAIAEYCGWKIDDEWEDGALMGTHDKWGWNPVPDYLDDLYAIHEAVENIGPSKLHIYAQHLQEEVGYHVVGVVPGDYHSDLRHLVLIAHATARQRAEAFLKTIQAP